MIFATPRHQHPALLRVGVRWRSLAGMLLVVVVVLLLEWLAAEALSLLFFTVLGLCIAMPSLLVAFSAFFEGHALRISGAGIQVAGLPLLSWPEVRSVQVLKRNDESWGPGVELHLLLRPSLAQRFRRNWLHRLVFSRFYILERSDMLRLSTHLWKVTADELRAALSEAAHLHKAPELLDVRMAAHEHAAAALRKRVDDARHEAIALVQSGAKSNDPALRAAWQRYDELRTEANPHSTRATSNPPP